ncbi:MAG: response regulator [Moraxellaceae bacterium]|nr:response regulator [Moraxellaceae bacterium]
MSLNTETLHRHAVLVVDDALPAQGFLCEALEAAGYTVMLAGSGEAALETLALTVPDALLLDAVMPGLSGFETCRRIKADAALAHVPVIFMTGLSDTSDIVAGFAAGGVDYVVKPVRVEEVLARLATHVRNARVSRLAREAIDVGGHGVVMIDSQGRVAWCSPKAAYWLHHFLPEHEGNLPDGFRQRLLNGEVAPHARLATLDDRSLQARGLGTVSAGEYMVLLEVRNADAAGQAEQARLAAASLTQRETEVLSWLAKGKTNRDIGEILGMSPRTVNKHLEHIFEKLGVETRAAAAALATRALAVE